MPRSRTPKMIFESVRNDSGGILVDFRDNWPPRDFPEEGQRLDMKTGLIGRSGAIGGSFGVKHPLDKIDYLCYIAI